MRKNLNLDETPNLEIFMKYSVLNSLLMYLDKSHLTKSLTFDGRKQIIDIFQKANDRENSRLKG